MKNWYQRLLFIFLGFSLTFLSLISILALLEWNPILNFVSWCTKGGLILSLVFLIIFFIVGFITFVSALIYREYSTLNIGSTSGLGEVRISIQGIRNSIKDIAQYFNEIQEIKPDIKIVRDKMYLSLRIKIPVGVDVNRIVNELQQRIKVYFENVLGINLDKIEVIIEDVIIPVKRAKQ